MLQTTIRFDLACRRVRVTNELRVLNNADFYADWNVIDFVGSVGRDFRMNVLLNKDHIKHRLSQDDAGLSLTEFFYTVLQSYDFAYLNQKYECSLQIGGSDQWGNITNGCDFVRKAYKKHVYGITTPLLVDKSGNKFGKSDGNAIWLDPEMSRPNDIRQYILNIPDDAIEEYLKKLTFLELEEITEVMRKHNEKRELRQAQLALASELLAVIHGA